VAADRYAWRQLADWTAARSPPQRTRPRAAARQNYPSQGTATTMCSIFHAISIAYTRALRSQRPILVLMAGAAQSGPPGRGHRASPRHKRRHAARHAQASRAPAYRAATSHGTGYLSARGVMRDTSA
jgi:hypothetical protein